MNFKRQYFKETRLNTGQQIRGNWGGLSQSNWEERWHDRTSSNSTLSLGVQVGSTKRSVTFECVTVEGSEKLFSSRLVASYSSSDVMMKLNYGIRIHYEVTENWIHTVSKLYHVWLWPAACAEEGFGIHVQKKAFFLQSLLNTHTYTFLSLWSTESTNLRV
jgi:hypothetical protein